MLISTKSVTTLAEEIESGNNIFCSGLFLSARWMVVSQLDHQGIQMIILPDKDSAEYCASDLYSFINEDNVCRIYGRYRCIEMIGRVQNEEIINKYGEDHRENR